MAERRMFAKTITNSDSFLEMPLSSQCLYFHLNMNADDDGFVNSPKRIQRMINASDDDFKILIAKSFILTFESGVIVIKHWRLNNYIQKDRYKETVYLEEKNKLNIKDNKAYTLSNNDTCIQNVYNSYTQVRLGKNSIDKNNIEVVGENIDSTNYIEIETTTPANDIFTYYQNEISSLSPTQFEKLKKHLEKLPSDLIKIAIDKTNDSGARSFNYLEAILKQWEAKNYKTISDIKKETKKTKNSQPGWLNKEIESQDLPEEEIEELENDLKEYR